MPHKPGHKGPTSLKKKRKLQKNKTNPNCRKNNRNCRKFKTKITNN